MAAEATRGLSGVWGSSASDVFAVGSSGLILHYDGTSWTPMPLQSAGQPEDLRRVWGSSGTDVFAVGGSTLLHYDGTRWSPEILRKPVNGDGLRDVWGRSGSDVYVVVDGYAIGREGAIFHYNGVGWQEFASWTSRRLSRVWGTPGGDLLAVGPAGVDAGDGIGFILRWRP
jgi:hypothetical protein